MSRVILSSHMWVIKMPGSHLPATKRKDKNLEINEFARFLKVNCVVNMYSKLSHLRFVYLIDKCFFIS